MTTCPAAPAVLETAPETPHKTSANGVGVTMAVIIPHYRAKVTSHFDAIPGGKEVAPAFEHFGLRVEFEREVELDAYDADWVLHDNIKDMARRFGVVLFKGAHLSTPERARGQRNIFPSLDFHYDRPPDSDNVYSFFTRDPFDPAHAEPRTSSTLLCANVVCYAQALREGDKPHDRIKANYRLFKGQRIEPLVDEILIEEKWQAPKGCGEICVFDNRTVLHASYYPSEHLKGYPIGVRYLF